MTSLVNVSRLGLASARRKTFAHFLPDTTTVIVQLLDVNDNAPLFVLREYEQVIRENKSVDTAILRVTATDRDSGSNSDLQYDITQGNTNKSFSIDNNGVIRLRAGLLGQSIKLFNLTVVATDKGSPRLSSRPTFVYIRVRRRTDPTGPPTLFPAIYRTSINESFPVGGRVLRVRVRTDRPAEQISYRLFNNVMPDVNEHFRVEHRTGIISLTKSLDYEAKKAYSFYVGAHGMYATRCFTSGFIYRRISLVENCKLTNSRVVCSSMYFHFACFIARFLV